MQYNRPFTKLFSSIITSSIWNEDDKTRVVWITALALSDANGIVCASVGGLAHAARVSEGDCMSALDRLMEPDADSRSSEFEGRRIQFADEGFQILNYKKYRDLGKKLDRNEYLADKQWEHRQRVNKRQQSSTLINKASTNASASASASEYIKELSADSTYQGIDVEREFGKMANWCKVHNVIPTRRRFVNWLNRADKPIKATKADYKRNYVPAGREPTEEELAAQRKIVREASEKLKNQLAKGIQ